VIQFLWQRLLELWSYIQENFHPIWDSLDILAVTFAVYWLLLLIRGTRAVQMLTGLLVLIAVRLISDWAQLATVGLILENFFTWGVIIIIILFQQDIRRALARMGRGFFPAVSRQEETQMLEEIVRAAQTLASKRVGALVVLERETRLDDLVEAGVRLDAVPTKELLTAIFLPYSPLHDGAVVVQEGRLTHAGCVLPLTLRSDLPEGVGTRHRAAVGITEDSDAVVVVISEESAAISVVVAGEMTRDLDAPRLREVLRDLLAGDREPLDVVEPDVSEDKPSHLRSVGSD
jgi:uncharacterized protein (TIGR00159 family)